MKLVRLLLWTVIFANFGLIQDFSITVQPVWTNWPWIGLFWIRFGDQIHLLSMEKTLICTRWLFQTGSFGFLHKAGFRIHNVWLLKPGILFYLTSWSPSYHATGNGIWIWLKVAIRPLRSFEQVWSSEIFSLVAYFFRCQMDLHKFPLDFQTCPLIIGSFGHDAGDIVYKVNKQLTL